MQKLTDQQNDVIFQFLARFSEKSSIMIGFFSLYDIRQQFAIV